MLRGERQKSGSELNLGITGFGTITLGRSELDLEITHLRWLRNYIDL